MTPRILRTAILAAVGLASAPLSAQAYPTVTYRGTITFVSGPHADAAQVGQRITAEYSVDPAAADADPNPGNGVFYNGLKGLRIEVPASGVVVTTGSGTVQTFNDDASTSDQVFFYSSNLLTGLSLGGESVTEASVEFQDWAAGPAGMPTMINDDSLPVGELSGSFMYTAITTAQGRTVFQFMPDTMPTVDELVQDGLAQLAAMVATGRVQGGIAHGISAKLRVIAAYAEAGDIGSACIALTSFRNQVSNAVRAQQLSASSSAELIVLAAEIQLALRGC